MAIEHGKLTVFPWSPDLSAFAKKLRVEAEDMEAFSAVFQRAEKAYNPRVYSRALRIDAIGDDFVQLCGEWFDGTRVAGLLADATQVHAYVATAGAPPERANPGDTLEAWWLQAIGEAAVHHAAARFSETFLCEDGETVSSISPGSLPDWPITQQAPLFRLLGSENAGVSLTDSFLMLPRCSVSGLLFAAPRAFCSCAHCDKCSCPNRRAEQET